MNTSSLRAVTLKTVANYAQAAERAVVAYRVGGHRLIAAMQRGVDLAAQNGPERLATALRRAGGNVSDLASKGLDAVSSRTERAIEIGSTGVTAQLARAADLAEGVDNKLVASGLQAVARISLPGAQAALALSERVVAGAGKLPGSPLAKAGAKVRAGVARSRQAAKPQTTVEAVVRELGKAAAKASKAAAPVVAQVKAEVKAAIKPKAARKPVAKPAAKPVAKDVKAAVTAGTTRARRAVKASPVAKAVEAGQDAVAA